jgi:long-chain alkane monooxygenase
MTRRFHLGWFTNFTPDEWNGPFSNGGMPWDGKFYVEMAQALERAKFDYILLEDKLAVSESYGGTSKAYLKHALGMVPKHDPMPLVTLMGAATSRVGVVATMSTLAYPPFLLARLASTVDHISGGRFGWNIVTSAEDAAAQNFGLEKLPPRELRYAMAHEYMDLVYQLFDSWQPDAVIRDRGASRRLAKRAQLRRQARRLRRLRHPGHRQHARLPRRHSRPRQGARAQPRRREGAVPGRPRARRDGERGARSARAPID